MNDRPQDQGMADEPPTTPPPPPPAPPAPNAVDLESSASVRSGGIAGRIAVGALGVALLVGGVAFAATQADSDTGASDPVSAVEEMLDAIADEDVLGVLATLDPAERDTIADPVEQLFSELERLAVLDESFELGGVEGVDLEFQDLDFETREIRDDLYRVHLVGGTASYAVDADRIPVGDFLVDTFDRLGVEYRGVEESGSDALDPSGSDETFLVARDTGDGWRVSLAYTAVEAARIDMGAAVPAVGGGLAPRGADTPQLAVQEFLEAVVAIDVEGAVARLSPDELGAVHDYWNVLVADDDLPTAADVPAQIELTDLELRAEEDGDRARVFVDSIGVDVVTEDFAGGATVAHGCIEVRGDVRRTFEDEGFDLPAGPVCRDDIDQIIEEAAGGLNRMGLLFGGLGGLGELSIGDATTPELGITVVEIDELGWFVAPLGTWTDLWLATIETLEREDVDALVDSIEGSFGGMVGGGFVPGMTDGFEDSEVFEDLGEARYDG